MFINNLVFNNINDSPHAPNSLFSSFSKFEIKITFDRIILLIVLKQNSDMNARQMFVISIRNIS